MFVKAISCMDVFICLLAHIEAIPVQMSGLHACFH